MSEAIPETTRSMRIVYSVLVNLNDPHRPRTQKDVCNVTGLASSTVSDQVAKLLKGKFLNDKFGSKSRDPNKLYTPGKNRGYIEQQIMLDRQYYGEYFGINGQGITHSEHAIHTPASRSHLNGGWIYFTVENEGLLGKIPTFEQPLNKNLFISLFPKKWTTKGNTQHYSNVLALNGEHFPIKYVRGKTADKMKFGICPPQLIQTVDEVSDDLSSFVAQAVPILEHLEKRADWKFAKGEDNLYIVSADVKQECGLDPVLTASIGNVLGDSWGVPGVTPIHSDNSIPGGEGEVTGAGTVFTASDYFKAIANTPLTERKVSSIMSYLAGIHETISTSEISYSEDLAKTNVMLARVSNSILQLAQNQDNLAVLMKNQQDLDRIRSGPEISGIGKDNDGVMYQ